MIEYKKVENLQDYVNEKLSTKALIVTAEKFARIIARQGVPGEEIISWSIGVYGQPVEEKVTVVSVDEVTGQPDWIATKIDEERRVVIDRNGNLNQWVIKDATFKQRYVKEPNAIDVYKPSAGPQNFLLLEEPISAVQWGEVWNVDAGGYINITDKDNYYVISKKDFEDTYKIID